MFVRPWHRHMLTIVTVAATLVAAPAAQAAPLPSGFSQNQIASLAGISDLAAAPDGRVFVSQQSGQIRIVKNGALLPRPFVTVPVHLENELGLKGIELDPQFTTNRYIYVVYTARGTVPHNRVSRFTAVGDVAQAGSERVLFELGLMRHVMHTGGDLHVSKDGKLLVSTGSNLLADGAPQRIDNLYGKLLRINRDGTIPTDNPFYSRATGANRAIWALGLRNPFKFAVQPGTGKVFIGDVGERRFEEINLGIRGANYGWPLAEGPSTNPRFTDPLFFYSHSPGRLAGCAIVGSAFYNPAIMNFPASYRGDFFFADYCARWIATRDSVTGAVRKFATAVGDASTRPVDVLVTRDGSLYYATRGPTAAHGGALWRIRHSAG